VNTFTRNAAKLAYEQAGAGPEDLDLVELRRCFATAELLHYDNRMLRAPGGPVTSSTTVPPGGTGRPG
jgi:acetyl-CoA acetyltransferase